MKFEHMTWLRRGALSLGSLALAVGLTACPPAGDPATPDGTDSTAETPTLEAQLEEAKVDATAINAEAEAEAETITADEAADVLTDLEAELSEDLPE